MLMSLTSLKLIVLTCFLFHSVNSFQAPQLITRWLLQRSPTESNVIRLRPSPLIGGPSWLPLHVQLIIENQYVWDFVPLDATSSTTLRQLLLLQSVPAEIRCLVKPNGKDNDETTIRRLQEEATLYAKSYPNTHLHLLTNNCWTFGLGMLLHLLSKNNEELERDADSL